MIGRSRHNPNRTQAAFTLVELLVAIAIVAILGSLVLGVAVSATGTAREAKTKSMITRLHSLLMERYDLYRTRRVEVRDNAAAVFAIDSAGLPGYSDSSGISLNINARQAAAATRVAALREMMKLEMPDRWSDVLGVEIPTTPIEIPLRRPNLTPPAPSFLFVQGEPAPWFAYARAYNQSVANGATRDQLLTNQGAECLYLVIMNATGDGEAPGLFGESDVGDTDGDGALEFLDGWGNPISFVRWAPGFESDAQLSVPGLQQLWRRPPRDELGVRLQPITAVQNAVLEDHDPYDMFRLDNADFIGFSESTDTLAVRGWRLVPLIVSAGPDEELGIRTEPEYVAAANPYADVSSDTGIQRLGEALDVDAPADNIHNHTLGTLVRTQ